MFEKLPSGYQMTAAGEEILAFAEQMEAISTRLETRVFGRDQSLVGTLRVALASPLATNLLMPDIAEFCARHPEIELQLLTSFEPVNLTKRQADIAIRLVYDRKTLPPHLFGVRLHDVYRGVYLSRDLLAKTIAHPECEVKWLLKSEDGAAPDWAVPDQIKTAGTAVEFTEMQTQIAATKASMGLAVMPCFIGDRDPDLVRALGSQTRLYGTLWLLMHGETRKTKRVRLFVEFMRGRLVRNADLLAGLDVISET